MVVLKRVSILVLIASVLTLAQQPAPAASPGRYQLFSAKAPKRNPIGFSYSDTVLLLDTQTGTVWEYVPSETFASPGHFEIVSVDGISKEKK